MAVLNIPKLEEIDANWLTDILQKSGHHQAIVNNFSYETIGTGQIGKCVRFTLDLAPTAEQVKTPTTLVGKFPSDNDLSRSTGVEIQAYLKEIVFYRDFVPLLNISTPTCYFADIADDNERFILILEDMSPAVQGDQLKGCSVNIVQKAVQELVGLHAPSWCNENLLSINSVVKQTQTALEYVQTLYQQYIEGFIERYGDQLSIEQQNIFKKVATTNKPTFSSEHKVYSLIHIDYRLDNLLMIPNDENAPITVVDWQTISTGNPLSDVAYIIASSLSIEERRIVEVSLVKSYYQGLIDAGIADYSWDECWHDYRLGVFSAFSVTVVGSMMVKQTDRGDEMFLLMADRYSQQAIDLCAEELLPIYTK